MNQVIEALRTLLRSTLGSTYKKYYYGEIRVPNQAFMPFVEIFPISTAATNRGTGGMMNNEYRIQINVKSTLKKYIQQNTNVEKLDYVYDLVEKVEWRETNGDLKSSTILGVLHDNLQLTATANINGDWQISYDEMDLGESYITIASISFTVKVVTT